MPKSGNRRDCNKSSNSEKELLKELGSRRTAGGEEVLNLGARGGKRVHRKQESGFLCGRLALLEEVAGRVKNICGKYSWSEGGPPENRRGVDGVLNHMYGKCTGAATAG